MAHGAGLGLSGSASREGPPVYPQAKRQRAAAHAMTGSDDLRQALERELYWLTQGEGREPPTTAEQIRLAADRLAQRLRRDAMPRRGAIQASPGARASGGSSRSSSTGPCAPSAGATTGSGRSWRSPRPRLADAVIQVEAELRRLRTDLEALEERMSARAPSPPEG